MFISQAFAQTAETANQVAVSAFPDSMKVIIQFALIFFVLYFLLIRPQQKKFKEHEKELNSIVRGSQVIVGGMIGRVVSVEADGKLNVELAKDVRVTVLRAYVAQVIPAETKKEK